MPAQDRTAGPILEERNTWLEWPGLLLPSLAIDKPRLVHRLSLFAPGQRVTWFLTTMTASNDLVFGEPAGMRGLDSTIGISDRASLEVGLLLPKSQWSLGLQVLSLFTRAAPRQARVSAVLGKRF